MATISAITSRLPNVFAHRVERHHRRGQRQQPRQNPLARDRQHHRQQHLQHGLDLAAHARRDDVPLLHGAQPQAGNDEFPRDEDDAGRDVQPPDGRQHDECGMRQQLVGNRVHELAEIRNQVARARDAPVEHIRQRRGDKHQQRPDAHRLIVVKRPEQQQVQRHHRHAQQRQLVGQVHRANRPPRLFQRLHKLFHMRSPIRSYAFAAVIFTFTNEPISHGSSEPKKMLPSVSGASYSLRPT